MERKIYYLISLMPFLLLIACTKPSLPTGSHQNQSQSIESIKTRIRQAKVTVIAASQKINEYVKDGKMTPDQGQIYLNEVTRMNDYVNQAQSLLIEGKITLAGEKLNLAEVLLDYIKKQIGSHSQ